MNPYDLSSTTASNTYTRLLQTVNGTVYDGLGNTFSFGQPSPTWNDLAMRSSGEPILTGTISSGDVYSYSYQNGTTLYRLVPDPYLYANDAFYSNFDGFTLSNFIVNRVIF